MTWNRTLTLTLDVDAPYGRVLIGSLTDTSILNNQPVLIVGDHFPLRIQLARRDPIPTNPATGVTPAPGTTFVLSAKAPSGTGDLLFYADTFSQVLDESSNPIPGLFEADLDLNTTPLLDYIAASPVGPKSLLCELEIRDAANTRRYSLQFDATARPQVYQGTEGVPTSGTPPYPAPGDIMLKSTYDPDNDGLINAEDHTHTAAQISDSTPAGRAMLTAADAQAQAELLDGTYLQPGGINAAYDINASSVNASYFNADYFHANYDISANGEINANGEITANGVITAYGGINTYNIYSSNDLTVDGNATLGYSSADSVQINAGTILAPNATSTEADRLANVGALDALYPRIGRFFQITNFQGVTAGQIMGGGNTTIEPFWFRYRVNAGSNNSRAGVFSFPGSLTGANYRFNLASIEFGLVFSFGADSRAEAGIYFGSGSFAGASNFGNGPIQFNSVIPGVEYRAGNLIALRLRGVRCSSASRSSNVVTVTSNGAHGLVTGDLIAVAGMLPSSFQTRRASVTVIDAMTFSYANAGPDETATQVGDSAGVSEIEELGAVALPVTANVFDAANGLTNLLVRLNNGTATFLRNGVQFASGSGFSSTEISNFSRIVVGLNSTANATNVTDLEIQSLTIRFP